MSQYLKPCGCDEDEYCDQCHPPRTAEAEIERLRSELETERGHRVADNAESRQEIERLRAALEQYADESNWNCAGVCVVCEAYSYAEQMIRLHVRDWWQGDDPGYAIAQAALEAAGGGGVMDDDREELLRRTLANQTRLLEKIERLRGALNRVRADVELWSVTGRHRNCDCRACEDLRAIAARAAEGGGGG